MVTLPGAVQVQSYVLSQSIYYICYSTQCSYVYCLVGTAYTQLLPFNATSVSQPTCLYSLSCYFVYRLSCYLASLQPVMLLSLSIACHVTQPVYSLSCYLASLQPVILLSLSIACHITLPVYSLSCYLASLQPAILLSLSIACHATQPVYRLLCYLAYLAVGCCAT